VGRDGGINKSVSTKWRSRIFLQRGLDTRINKLPDEAGQELGIFES